MSEVRKKSKKNLNVKSLLGNEWRMKRGEKFHFFFLCISKLLKLSQAHANVGKNNNKELCVRDF